MSSQGGFAPFSKDEQTISLVGNTLSISNGNSVDLSGYVDTDDQNITDFSLNGSIVTLTIEDGNTVTLDLVSLDKDDQLLGLVGNILSISNGNTVDLSAYLDNTDDQTLGLVGTNLNISSGNSVDLSVFLDDDDITGLTATLSGTTLTVTVTEGTTSVSDTVDLASLLDNTDSQTLGLSGTTLSISGGNSVNLASLLDDTDISNVTTSLSGTTLTVSVTENGNTQSDTVDLSSLLDNTDSQTLTNNDTGGVTTGITISGGNTIPINHPLPQTLNVTTDTIYHEFYAGRSDSGTNVSFTRNATMTRTAAGQWQVRFTTAHPDGEDYTPEFSWEEPNTTRDNPKIGIVQGTQNANGFDVMITVDDNGATADPYSDQPWTFGVEAPITVVTNVTIS